MNSKSMPVVLSILAPSIILRAFAMDIFLPCIPALAQHFVTDFSVSQWALSMYFLGAGMGQLLMGPLADEYGRRKVLLIATAILIMASMLCAWSTSIVALIVWRFLQGIGASGTTDATMAILRDLYDDKALPKVYSYFNSIVALAPLIAPILGAVLLVNQGWQATFYFTAAFASIGLIISYRYIPETNPDLPAEIKFFKVNILQSYKKVITDSYFMRYALCAVMAFSALFLFFSTSSILMIQKLGISEHTFGYYFAANSVAFILGNCLSPWLVNNYALDKTIIFGSSTIILGGILMLAAHYLLGLTALGLMLPNMLATIGIGAILGPCMAGAMHEYKHLAGIASAVYGALVYGMSSITVAVLMQIPIIDATVLAIGLTVFGVINIFMMHRKLVQNFATSY